MIEQEIREYAIEIDSFHVHNFPKTKPRLLQHSEE